MKTIEKIERLYPTLTPEFMELVRMYVDGDVNFTEEYERLFPSSNGMGRLIMDDMLENHKNQLEDDLFEIQVTEIEWNTDEELNDDETEEEHNQYIEDLMLPDSISFVASSFDIDMYDDIEEFTSSYLSQNYSYSINAFEFDAIPLD
jgi:hypothetical protein